MTVSRWSIIVVLALALSGCGIKPKHLKAPEDADPQAYPKSYPVSK